MTCWPSEGASETAVVVEITNNSELTFTDMTFQVLHSRFDNIKVNYNEGGTFETNADSLNWLISKLGGMESVKLEFITTSELNNILPFSLVATSPESISKVKVRPRLFIL